jgi:hypothetical protein
VVSAVYLNLHALAERGSLLQPGPDIYAMFTAAMLESLPEKTRGFLAVLRPCEAFEPKTFDIGIPKILPT